MLWNDREKLFVDEGSTLSTTSCIVTDDAPRVVDRSRLERSTTRSPSPCCASEMNEFAPEPGPKTGGEIDYRIDTYGIREVYHGGDVRFWVDEENDLWITDENGDFLSDSFHMLYYCEVVEVVEEMGLIDE